MHGPTHRPNGVLACIAAGLLAAVTAASAFGSDPAAPVLTGTPAPVSDETSADFSFSGEPGGAFSCSVDGSSFTTCTDPEELTGVTVGTHSFAVRQTDGAGNTGPASTTSWTVVAPPVEPTAVNETLDSSIFVEGTGVTVGCSLDLGSLAVCDVFADLAGFHATPSAHAPHATGVLGHGRIAINRRGIRRVTVRIELNHAARVLLAHHLRGVRVRFDVDAQPFDDIPLHSTRTALVRAGHIRVVPEFGEFRAGSAALSPHVKSYLATVARLASPVKSITCVGYTSAVRGSGSAAYRHRLGLQRARAVCAALRRLGVSGRLTAVGRGGRSPAASNRTPIGRALNRRVELVISR